MGRGRVRGQDREWAWAWAAEKACCRCGHGDKEGQEAWHSKPNVVLARWGVVCECASGWACGAVQGPGKTCSTAGLRCSLVGNWRSLYTGCSTSLPGCMWNNTAAAAAGRSEQYRSVTTVRPMLNRRCCCSLPGYCTARMPCRETLRTPYQVLSYLRRSIRRDLPSNHTPTRPHNHASHPCTMRSWKRLAAMCRSGLQVPYVVCISRSRVMQAAGAIG